MKPPRLGREVLKRGALNINELVAPTGFDRQTCFRLFRSSDSRRPRSDARELGAVAGPAPLLPSSPLDWHAKRVPLHFSMRGREDSSLVPANTGGRGALVAHEGDLADFSASRLHS